MSTIKIEKKSQLVKEVFDSVASRYDAMNDIMSLGMHRLWKDKMVNSVHFTKNSKILDIAGGTGDIAIRIVRKEPIIPKIGSIVAKDRSSYEYLVKSIREFPTQADFKMEIEEVGFKNVEFHNMSYGIVALHIGTK
uniref:2-methoxy-6-polyprenyl-1,4-benzoquinol methylase, mitochondrial n=1 Tax=Timema poppense TaxID=170557 RepID=A0A7R9DSF3_TIMPO|nr:unnamed protein product [Timema poppensis]